jgi:hypothetical protein
MKTRQLHPAHLRYAGRLLHRTRKPREWHERRNRKAAVDMDAITKRNDLGILYRRQELTDNHDVTFTHYRPEIPDGQPQYPLRWIATWTDAEGDEHKSEPMAMPELIPHVETSLAFLALRPLRACKEYDTSGCRTNREQKERRCDASHGSI